jgi:hypothetical protein
VCAVAYDGHQGDQGFWARCSFPATSSARPP